MAIKRAVRKGECLPIPLLCDPEYQARRSTRIGEGMGAKERRAEVESEERVFRDTLDSSVLKTPLDGITRVVIRGILGTDFADAQADAYEVGAGNDSRFGQANMVAVFRRGLVSYDGAQETPESLSGEGGLGSFWPAVLYEAHARIQTWSSMGESPGSSSAQPSGEPV